MKIVFLILFILSGKIFAEIDDSSFINKDRFVFLKEETLGATDSLNLDIEFVPPKGKKVNKASFVKIYEKLSKDWNLVETVELDNAPEEFDGHLLTHNSILKSKKSEIALEIDFIHCDFAGRQCDQERYLGKIKRNIGKKSNKLSYKLKIRK